MTNQEILRIALEQSAIDSNCRPEDFLSGKQTVVLSQPHPDARRYLKLPFFCDLTTYGNNIVASVSEEIVEPVKTYIEKYTTYHKLTRSKTTNLGSMYKLWYEITLKDAAQEKEFIDELRIRNGNLEISMINGREDAFNEL